MENFNAISWINTLPSGWKAVKLKYLLEQGKGSMKVGPFGSQLSGKDFTDEGYWVYNQKVVVNQDFDETDAFISEDKYNSMDGFQVETGDILITTRGTIGRICRVPKVYHPGIIHPCIIRFRIDEEKVLYNLVRLLFNESNMIKDQLDFMSNATTIDVVYSEPLKNVYIPIAPLNVQCKLTSYLQDKCSDIDTMTADIQSEIDTLEKYKRSVITEAVTKGLDKNAELKDSGVFYIGPINKKWYMSKIGHVCSKLARSFNSEGLALICSNKGKVVIRDENASGSMVSEDHAMQGIRKGDIAIHGMDTWHGAIALSDYDGKITRVVHVCDSSEDKRFIVYWLQHLAFQGVYKLISNGVRENTSDFRSWDKVKDIHIALPRTHEEEQKICNYLDETCKNIESVISKKTQQLDMLAAYKKSLIYEYVTGKKEVPSSWQN